MQKTILPTALALTGLALLQGCSIFGGPVAERVAKVIDKYCEEPYNQRAVYRDTVNDELAIEGHSILVTCAGDPSHQE